MDEFTIEDLERCKQWAQSGEGYIFFKWLESEVERVNEGKERYIGAWEQDKIIKANKMIARIEEAEYIQNFFSRLSKVIDFKKTKGDVLTTVEEL